MIQDLDTIKINIEAGADENLKNLRGGTNLKRFSKYARGRWRSYKFN